MSCTDPLRSVPQTLILTLGVSFLLSLILATSGEPFYDLHRYMSTVDLHYHFGVDTYDHVPDYDLFTPYYTPAYRSFPKIAKTNRNFVHPAEFQFQIRIFDRNYTINALRNDQLVTSDFSATYHGKTYGEKLPFPPARAVTSRHYLAEVVPFDVGEGEDENGYAAFSTSADCGLYGIVKGGDRLYRIKPVKQRVLDRYTAMYDMSDQDFDLHVVYLLPEGSEQRLRRVARGIDTTVEMRRLHPYSADRYEFFRQERGPPQQQQQQRGHPPPLQHHYRAPPQQPSQHYRPPSPDFRGGRPPQAHRELQKRPGPPDQGHPRNNHQDPLGHGQPRPGHHNPPGQDHSRINHQGPSGQGQPRPGPPRNGHPGPPGYGQRRPGHHGSSVQDHLRIGHEGPPGQGQPRPGHQGPPGQGSPRMGHPGPSNPGRHPRPSQNGPPGPGYPPPSHQGHQGLSGQEQQRPGHLGPPGLNQPRPGYQRPPAAGQPPPGSGPHSLRQPRPGQPGPSNPGQTHPRPGQPERNHGNLPGPPGVPGPRSPLPGQAEPGHPGPPRPPGHVHSGTPPPLRQPPSIRHPVGSEPLPSIHFRPLERPRHPGNKPLQSSPPQSRHPLTAPPTQSQPADRNRPPGPPSDRKNLRRDGPGNINDGRGRTIDRSHPSDGGHTDHERSLALGVRRPITEHRRHHDRKERTTTTHQPSTRTTTTVTISTTKRITTTSRPTTTHKRTTTTMTTTPKPAVTPPPPDHSIHATMIMGVIADYGLYLALSQSGLTKEKQIFYILAFYNEVQAFYQEPSLVKHVHLTFAIKSLGFITNPANDLGADPYATQYLHNLCLGPYNMPDYDHLQALTMLDMFETSGRRVRRMDAEMVEFNMPVPPKRDDNPSWKSGKAHAIPEDKKVFAAVGLALLGSTCSRLHHCSVVEMNSFTPSLSAAHELGHSLGMNHEGVNGCPVVNSLTSFVVPTQPMKSAWTEFAHLPVVSHCAVKELVAYLKGEGKCLVKEPPPDVERMFKSRLHDTMAQPFTADQVCKLRAGPLLQQMQKWDSQAEVGAEKLHDPIICKSLHCYGKKTSISPDKLTGWIFGPAPVGTQCNKQGTKFCFNFNCVDRGMLPKQGLKWLRV